MGTLPLNGVRIADLTMGFAGPLATKILAAMGAEVIKVESCQRIDWWRGRSAVTSPEDVGFEQSPRFNTTNMYKYGITLNLTDQRGVALLRRLVEISDVVIENYSARVMANFGLEYDVLKSWREDIIMVSMPGFGTTGPWRDYVAFGQTVESISGLTYFNGYAGGDPRLLSNGADPFVGVNGAIATLLALLHRRKTGQGQRVELAQIEAITPFVGPDLVAFQMDGSVRERMGNASARMAPHGCYPAKGDDKWVTIAVSSDEEWTAFCHATGNSAWANDTRFNSPAGRIKERRLLDELIAQWTRSRDRYEVMKVLQEAGVAAGPVLSGMDLRFEPQLHATGFFEAIDRKYVGTHEYPGVPIRLAGRATRDAAAAPCLGEHNRYVLEERLGVSPDELEALREQGVIGERPIGPRMA